MRDEREYFGGPGFAVGFGPEGREVDIASVQVQYECLEPRDAVGRSQVLNRDSHTL